MTLQPNATLLNGKYRIEAFIGQGASARVYRATHLRLKQQRALKVLRRDASTTAASGVGSTEYSDYRQRFGLEAQLGAKITHPNVIQVFDFEEEGSLLVLAMEYAAGGSLGDRIALWRERGQPMPIEQAIGILLDAANGVAAIHAQDAVHRDLKPTNILLDANGHAKVADLGLAQVPGGPSMRSQLSQARPHPGTPAYMSLEQANASTYLTPASDVYTLGLIAFELLTGRAYKNMRPGTRISASRKDVPPRLDDLVLRMLDDDPRKRPFNGDELASELRSVGIDPQWVREEPPKPPVEIDDAAVRDAQPVATAHTPAMNDVAPVAASAVPNKTRSKRWVVAAALGGLVLVGIIVGAWITNMTRPASIPDVKIGSGIEIDGGAPTTQTITRVITPTSVVATMATVSTLTPRSDASTPTQKATLNVLPQSQQTQATPSVQPEGAVPPGAHRQASGCISNLSFVSDVNYPDNTVVKASESFVKKWRVRNTGTCVWTAGDYRLEHQDASDDNLLGTTGAAPLSPAFVAAGATADIQALFVASRMPGTYRSTWQMVGPDNVPFGVQFYVSIVVEGAPATPPTSVLPTVTPTITPQPTETPSPKSHVAVV